MTKARVWSLRGLYMLIAAALVMGLIITGAMNQKVSASSGLSEPTWVNAAAMDGWVLAPESTMSDYSLIDGADVVYAVVCSNYEGGYLPLKSDGGAATWTSITDALGEEFGTGDSIGSLLRIATDRETPDFLSYSGLVVDGLGDPVATTDNGGVIYASYYRGLALNETDEDCYAQNHPDVVSPADGMVIPSDPSECGNVPFTIIWESLCDAQTYDIQFALDADFVSILEDISETGYLPPAPDMPNYVVPRVTLSCETTYYWRVRAVKADNGQVIHSLWSDPRQFTVGVGPGRGLEIGTPEPGATDAPITNIAFVWDSEAAFDSYDWVLSENADLSAPLATATGLTTKAYIFTGSLKYDTVYFWQVSAFWWNGALMSSSGIGTFCTVTEPAEPPPPGCFIATAAYGTHMAGEIQILREFRDEYLLISRLGEAFVDFYYRVSPSMAEFITEHPSLRPMVRAALLPAVAISTVAVNTIRAEKITIVGSLVFVSVAAAVLAMRRRGRSPERTQE